MHEIMFALGDLPKIIFKVHFVAGPSLNIILYFLMHVPRNVEKLSLLNRQLSAASWDFLFEIIQVVHLRDIPIFGMPGL